MQPKNCSWIRSDYQSREHIDISSKAAANEHIAIFKGTRHAKEQVPSNIAMLGICVQQPHTYIFDIFNRLWLPRNHD